MARNEVSRLKITIDIDQATGKILKFNQTLGNTKREVQQTGTAMGQLAGQTNQAGQSAAASAVHFQTFSQGMLNLGTTAVQTATSFSNLDRARNRAAASEVAFARAQDLVANKELRVRELEARGLANTAKYTNLRRELATATQDLTVKEEKMKIEQAAVNDVYMLFFANIANVGFSALQTYKSLLELNKEASIKAMLATKANTIAQHAHNLSMKTGIITVAGYTAQQNLGIVATRALTVSTKGLTFAVRGLNITLGPVGIAMAAITGVMLTWDHHLGKVFGSLGDLTGGILGATSAEEEMIDLTHELTGAVEAFNEEVTVSAFEALPHVIKMQKEYIRQLAATRDEIHNLTNQEAALRTARELGAGVPTGFSTGAVGAPAPISSTGNPVGTTTTGGTATSNQGTNPSTSGYESGTTSGAVQPEAEPTGLAKFGLQPFQYSKHLTRQFGELGLLAPKQIGVARQKAQRLEEMKTGLAERIKVLADRDDLSLNELNELNLLQSSYDKLSKISVNDITGDIEPIKEIPRDPISQEEQLKTWQQGLIKGFGFRADKFFEPPKQKKSEKTYSQIQLDFVKRMQETNFDYGTNTGGGTLQAINTMRMMGLGTQEINNFIGYAGGFTGMKTYAEQIEAAKLKQKVYPYSTDPSTVAGNMDYFRTEYLQRPSIEGVTGQGGVSSYFVQNGAVQTALSSRARQNIAAAEAMHRVAWQEEQQRNQVLHSGYGGGKSGFITRYYGQFVDEADLPSLQAIDQKLDSDLRHIMEHTHKGTRFLQDWALNARNLAEREAKKIVTSVSRRRAEEVKKATEYAQGIGIQTQKALDILRDQSQGEQTLKDMLAFEIRVEAMSTGVVS